MLSNKLIQFPVSVQLNVFARMPGIVYVGNAEGVVLSKSDNTDEVRKDIEFYNIPLEEPTGKRILASLQQSSTICNCQTRWRSKRASVRDIFALSNKRAMDYI
jgi:hypothetical protein